MQITKREREVITKLSEGLTTKEVARDLYLSPYTVESHKRNIFEKLQARTLLQLGAIAVRHGIIAVVSILIITPCISQSQFEIDGTIKATELIGNGNRAVVADNNGMLKVVAQDPAIIEIKDSTGDVRFRFDANQGLFQMLLNGDTLREIQVVPLPLEEEALGIKSGIAKVESEESGNTLVNDEVMPLINSLSDKFDDSSIPSPPVLGTDERVGEVTFKQENGEHSFQFTRQDRDVNGNLIQGVLGYSGKISSNGFITELEVFTNFPNTAEWTLKFINGMLSEIEYIENGSLIETKKVKKTFNSNCEVLTCIAKDSLHKEVITNNSSNSTTSADGQNIGAFSNLNPSLINAWLGIDINGLPAFAVGDENNQAAIGPSFYNIFNQDGITAQQVMFYKDGFQAVKDNDITDLGDTPQILDFKFDFLNNRIIVCGDVHVKGNITATGSIASAPSLRNEITKSNKNLISESLGSGNAKTDESGVATVQLPSFIQKNFYDFRYQLTTIGSFSDVIISKELHDGSFQIRSKDPNVKVSWQLSGLPSNSFLKSVAKANEISQEDIPIPKRIQSPLTVK